MREIVIVDAARGCTSFRKSSLNRIRDLIIAGAAFALAFLYASPMVFAAKLDCMPTYYHEKSPACLDDILEAFRQKPPNSPTETMIGFLARLFEDSPLERERILKAEFSEHVKQTELFGLYVAGLVGEAQILPLRTEW